MNLSPLVRCYSYSRVDYPVQSWEEKLVPALQKISTEVLILPVVGLVEIVVSLFIIFSLFHFLDKFVAPIVVIHNIQNMRGISLRNRAVAADNTKVLIVRVRGLVAEVVAAGNHDAVVTEGIDNQNLIVDDGVTELRQFLFPIRILVGHTADAGDERVWGLEQ